MLRVPVCSSVRYFSTELNRVGEMQRSFLKREKKLRVKQCWACLLPPRSPLQHHFEVQHCSTRRAWKIPRCSKQRGGGGGGGGEPEAGAIRMQMMREERRLQMEFFSMSLEKDSNAWSDRRRIWRQMTAVIVIESPSNVTWPGKKDTKLLHVLFHKNAYK